MAKKLMINCATCDARNILEENYAHYEQIIVNSAVMLTGLNAKAILNKLPFTLHCANVLEVEGDVDLRMVNGSGETGVLLETPEHARYAYTVFDCMGEILSTGKLAEKSLAALDVPDSGRVELTLCS